MKPEVDRRTFLTATAASAAFTIVPRHVLGQGYVAPSDKITVGYIGCGTEGIREMMAMLTIPEVQIVAVCDPVKDSNEYVEFGKGGMQRSISAFLGKPDWRKDARGGPGGRDVSKEIVETYYAQIRKVENFRAVNAYADFRELLAKEKDVNAVKVMTPDHLHATILLAAMKQGKHCVVHKPISKVATQMGNQGWSTDAIRVACEIIWSGEIGDVKEVHAWHGAPGWPQGMQKIAAPTSARGSGLRTSRRCRMSRSCGRRRAGCIQAARRTG